MSNWEDMQHVWDYTFRERLRCDPPSCNILLTGARRRAAGAAWPLPRSLLPQTRR